MGNGERRQIKVIFDSCDVGYYNFSNWINMVFFIVLVEKKMLFKISLKQISRTRARTITFLLLIILAVAFLTLGINLWWASNNNLKEYEKVFITLGMVNQKENMLKATAYWSNSSQDYTYYDEPVYDSILPISLLNLPELNYIVPPQQRPYYLAYSPGILTRPEEDGQSIDQWSPILEFIPYEDAVPNQPVRVQISKVLRGTVKVGDDLWVCDHSNPKPRMLKAGKRYITSGQIVYNQHPNPEPGAYYELWMNFELDSSQTDKQGVKLSESTDEMVNWYEVTDSFYASKIGKKIEAYIDAVERYIRYTVPVIPTNKTKLLMEFHQGEAIIRSGRDITQEEYESGAKVCLLPERLAGRNELKVGDTINLQLYLADYKRSASLAFFPSGSGMLHYSLLNAKGEAYPVFENSDYEIVGIYYSPNTTNYPTGYEIGNNVVIIPANSVKNSDENNIADYGPMKGYTTTFQILNGTTKEYLESFKALGIDNLEITFYDGGYEKLAAGMKNIRQIAIILLLVSIITTSALLLFFIYMFISKQKKRTAIERSLGMSRKECTQSMIYGVLSVITLGSLSGGLLGFLITGLVMPSTDKTGSELYMTEYSNWVNHADKISGSNTGTAANLIITLCACLMVILISYGLALLYIQSNLKAEPLALLSKKEE